MNSCTDKTYQPTGKRPEEEVAKKRRRPKKGRECLVCLNSKPQYKDQSVGTAGGENLQDLRSEGTKVQLDK